MVVYSCKKCGELNYLTPHAFWNITGYGLTLDLFNNCGWGSCKVTNGKFNLGVLACHYMYIASINVLRKVPSGYYAMVVYSCKKCTIE
jgi:hypothetical protein